MLTGRTFTRTKLSGEAAYLPVAAMLQEFERRSKLQALIVDATLVHSAAAISALVALQAAGLKLALNGPKPEQRSEAVGIHPELRINAESTVLHRPEPWSILRALEKLEVFPVHLAVCVADDLQAVDEGHNAGVWTIGVLRTPRALGITAEMLASLKTYELGQRLSDAAEAFRRRGVHYLIESVTQLPDIVSAINLRLRDGDRP